MRLRARLFFSFAFLFSFVFIGSFFLEDHLINTSLIKNEKGIEERLQKLNEQKIKQIETFISDVLNKYVSNINALLTVTKNTPILRYNFEITPESHETKTWLDSATLITNNKWIDLVQNSKNGKVVSTIFLPNYPCPSISLSKVSQHLYTVSENNKQFFAIRWDFPTLVSSYVDVKDLKLPQEDLSDFYLLFSKETLTNLDLSKMDPKDLVLSINPWYPFLKWIEVDKEAALFKKLFEEISFAQAELKTVKVTKAPSTATIGKKSYNSQELGINRYDQIGMVWGISTLMALGVFGDDPFDDSAPAGVIRTPKNSLDGEVLFREEFFRRQTPIRKDKTTKKVPIDVSPQLLFFEEDKNNCAFGNTLYLFDEQNLSELSIGIRAEKIFKEIALGIHKSLFFVADHQLLRAVNAVGEKEENFLVSSEDVEKILNQSQGELDVAGEKIVFLHVQPFEDRDFHFFVLNPKKEEVGLFNQINQNAHRVLRRVNMQMLLVGIIAICLVLALLDWIAIRLTKPIIFLANAAKEVGKGNLEQVSLPCKYKQRKDEIAQLSSSFEEMVNGLKEKEKVRRVLNKVVSKEIAAEILKTDLNLGGEEKIVTVFFADIRHFTQITEHMTPTQVIILINSCMSLVTEVVERFHGVVDKYVGDEIMALFGAPLDVKQPSLLAITCALEVIEQLDRWNEKRRAVGEIPIMMGIGIHTGKVLAGNMGGVDRVNYTVVGSNVNLAARLCALAKENEILVSEQALEQDGVQEAISYKALEPAQLKGFTEKVSIFKILSKKRT